MRPIVTSVERSKHFPWGVKATIYHFNFDRLFKIYHVGRVLVPRRYR